MVARVIGLAEEMGMPSRYVQTDYMNIEPRYRDSCEKRNFYGHFVCKTIVVTLKEIAAFEQLLSRAPDGGVTYVHGVQFHNTELRKYRDQARALAVRAVEEKAAALGGELGQQIGDPYRIFQEYSGWASWYDRWRGGRRGQGMTQTAHSDEEACGDGSAAGRRQVQPTVACADIGAGLLALFKALAATPP